MCFSCICLFILHALISGFIFLFLLVSGLAPACDCGAPFAFLLRCIYYQEINEINVSKMPSFVERQQWKDLVGVTQSKITIRPPFASMGREAKCQATKRWRTSIRPAQRPGTSFMKCLRFKLKILWYGIRVNFHLRKNLSLSSCLAVLWNWPQLPLPLVRGWRY